MKIQYKLGLMAMGLLAFSSCEKHDLVADNMAIGERVPTVYWTVASTACKAGEDFSFEGRYYTEDGHQPSHSEVWYSVIREDVVSAQAKLVSSLAFTQQSTITDTIRTMQHIKSYAHSLATWSGHEFVLSNSCPTSSTLIPVMWSPGNSWTETTWDKFNLYYPEGFEETFLADVKTKVMASETILRDVFCTYSGFTAERIDSINGIYNTAIPTVFDDDENTKEIKSKKELWYRVSDSNTDAEKAAAIIAYYYRNDAGVDVRVEKADILVDELGNEYAMNGEKKVFCYPVYDAAAWLYCRYDNDSGSIVTTVLDSYTDAFDAMVALIHFPEWIKGTAAEGYVASFKRTHKLSTVFKVVDTEGNVGMYTTPYEITLN